MGVTDQNLDGESIFRLRVIKVCSPSAVRELEDEI
jgi:hypothetical protein